MQSFVFRKVEVWLVLLIVILLCAGAIGFAGAALDAERGKNRYGSVGRASLAIASIPEDLRKLLNDRESLTTMQQGRFSDQPAGWMLSPGAAPLPGYLLLSRHDGEGRHHVVELVSLADGNTLHRWQPSAASLLAGAPRTSPHVDTTHWDDAHLRAIHPLLMPDGSLIIKDHETFATRIDACGRLLWRQDQMIVHHSTESDGEGGFWIPGLIEPSTFDDVEEGWREDALVHFDEDGSILKVISLAQVLVDHGRDWALFNASHRKRDPVHLNDIEPVLTDGPYWKKGDLFLSMRHTSEILLYRPSTNEILWSQQGPWLAQHDVDVLDDHRISIFDNHAYDRGKGPRIDVASRVVIFDFATGQITMPWKAALDRLEMRTVSEGLQTILPDGGLMVEEENAGRILFLAPDGALRAQFINRAPNGKTYRLGWSRWIDPDLGQEVLRHLKAQDCAGPPALDASSG
ncbi:hypothetical protein OU426_00240 [Frigidibacter sp. RF13]|uniref:arylsulfotransferase family protein n=1 Tax=Frigidibacter sp. RF13 TaxID=2997340 RepID=UPI002271F3E8|nr:arylsulfotransferase family protein [Frigidibacter sp. RF13]MCY1125271.1 hypothetical protein [Frigidibacter sp. RF13]